MAAQRALPSSPFPSSDMIATKNLPPPPDRTRIRRALLSVFDKTGLVPFAERLAAHGVALLSTGGTARALREAGLEVTDVSEVTGFPEILGGRVKTLHPGVHGGLLARRGNADDEAELAEHGIAPIDLVVVNLYPFEQATASPDVTDAVAAENIDIGGPTMLRAAAKNFAYVAVAPDPGGYDAIADELDAHGGTLGLATRRALAREVFAKTSAYDAAIAAYLGRTAPHAESSDEPSALPQRFALDLPREQTLRYGENPHQAAALFGDSSGLYETLHGKALSFNNLIDLSAALNLIAEFEHAEPTVAILKHTNPCGVATAATLAEAHAAAFATDRQSPFGGIVVVNRPLDRATADAIDAIFTEIIIAPSYEAGVLEALMAKKNRRLIRYQQSALTAAALDVRSVAGGLLVQQRDATLRPASGAREGYRVVTRRAPTSAEWDDLDFAWRVAKHVKSNAIVYAKSRATIGVGAGQMSRIDASEIAVMKGIKSELDFEGAVVASDAFFPFADGLLAAAASGARAVIQPGGSVRDDEVISAADEHGIAMVFTGARHFRH